MYNTLDCFRCAGLIVMSEVLFKEMYYSMPPEIRPVT
jgi:hypothetical protein